MEVLSKHLPFIHFAFRKCLLRRANNFLPVPLSNPMPEGIILILLHRTVLHSEKDFRLMDRKRKPGYEDVYLEGIIYDITLKK